MREIVTIDRKRWQRGSTIPPWAAGMAESKHGLSALGFLAKARGHPPFFNCPYPDAGFLQVPKPWMWLVAAINDSPHLSDSQREHWLKLAFEIFNITLRFKG